VVSEPQICMMCQKSKPDSLFALVHCSDAESRREIPVSLFCRKRGVPVASKLQHSNADPLFDFQRHIRSEHVSQDYLVWLLTVAPIADHPQLSFGLI
jgi:hypothetical protein